MKLFNAVLLLSCLSAAQAFNTMPPVFDISLDEGTALTRYQPATRYMMEKVGFNYSLGPLFDMFNKSLFEKLPDAVYQATEKALIQHFPEHSLEIQGVATVFAEYEDTAWITHKYLSAWVYMYGFAHLHAKPEEMACTGILVRQADGYVAHGRNMDFMPFSIRNMTYHINYYLKGEKLLESVTWTWLTGGAGVTSVAAYDNGFSSEVNWRYTQYTTVEQVVERALAGWAPIKYVSLDLYKQRADFSTAVATVANSTVFGPMYIIMAGAQPNEGAIITHNMTSSIVTKMPEPDSDEWFLVQTNYDRWLPDPPTDPRRTVAERHLMMQGKPLGSTLLGIFATLSTYPVHNPSTAHSTLMSAAHHFNTTSYVRDPLVLVTHQ